MAWSPEDDARLVTGSDHPWIVAGVQVVQSDDIAPRGFRLPESVGPVAYARMQSFAPLALTGGDGMVRDFIRNPTHELCTTLGLEQLSRAMATELAASPALARVRRLVVLAPKVELRTLLASPQLARLESITVVEATSPSLRALAGMPTSVHTLRVDNAVRAVTTGELRIDAIAELLATIAAPLTRLDLRGFGVPVEILAANPRLEGLAELVVDGCQLRGAELLGALRELRFVSARESSFDDTALDALASCPQLATLALRNTKITDEGARALAAAPLRALQTLDITGTKITDAGAAAIVRSNQLPALAYLEMDRELKYRSIADASTARLVGIDDAIAWLPPRPPPDPDTRERWFHLAHLRTAEQAVAAAGARNWWPKPPLPADRRFVHRTIYVCEYCRGTGQRAGMPCSYHRPTHEPAPHDAPLPPSTRDVVTIARTLKRFEAAEAHVQELARQLGSFGVIRGLRHVVWHLYDARWEAHHPPSYPPHPYHRLIARLADVPLAHTARWPFTALAAAQHADDESLVPLFERIVAIADLGYWLGPWRDDACTIYMHRDLGDDGQT